MNSCKTNCLVESIFRMHKNTFFIPNKTLNCRGKLVDLSFPRIMGILNVTPDSFFDGGRYQSEQAIVDQVGKMLEEGATIIDVGGMSSRPGAAMIKASVELDRVLPVVELIVAKFPDALISIDTVRSEVAQKTVMAGAHMVNDISAGSLDSELLSTVVDLQVPYILMHMQGRPETMQNAPQYVDVVDDVLTFFIKKTAQLSQLGVKDVILDVGFGFGKTMEQNYQLLDRLEEFNIFRLPLLVGISRKSMIYKLLETSPEEALNGTSVLHTLALLRGASILRVHDVRAAAEVLKIVTFMGERATCDVRRAKRK